MSERQRRIEEEAGVIAKHSPGLPDQVAETLAAKHVIEETDVGSGREQDKLGPLIDQGRARAYK